MKVVSTDALTKLIQLIKSAFIAKTDVEQTSEVTLATVATSGNYNDLSNKPDNSDFVHTSGDETISGTKSFTNVPNVYRSNPYALLSSSSVTKGTNPTDDNHSAVVAFTGSDKSSSSNNSLARLWMGLQTDGTTYAQLRAYKNTSNSNTAEHITVYYPASGSAYTYAPTPTDTTTDSGTQIATTGWVNSTGNNIVHLTNAETITGFKTFTSNIFCSKNSPQINIQIANASKGTTPSSNINGIVAFYDGNGTSQSNKLGQIYTQYYSNGNVGTYMGAFKPVSGDSTQSTISILYPASGNPYGTAPASDVNGSILTTVNKTKGNNGYYKLGNGLIIQWGSFTTGSNSTITFPVAFSNTNYSLAQVQTQTGSVHPNTAFTDKTTTTFKPAVTGVNNNDWIAIGY